MKEINKVAAISLETTGINFDDLNKAKNHQILSYGILIANSIDFIPIDGIYGEVKYDRKNIWNTKLEPLHGFTIDYLDKNGKTEEDAAAHIAQLFLDYSVDNSPIVLLSHNTYSFAAHFIRDIFNKYEVNIIISSRMLDTFTLAKTLFNLNDSKDLFKMFSENKKPNAIEKAEIYLDLFRMVKNKWNQINE